MKIGIVRVESLEGRSPIPSGKEELFDQQLKELAEKLSKAIIPEKNALKRFEDFNR